MYRPPRSVLASIVAAPAIAVAAVSVASAVTAPAAAYAREFEYASANDWRNGSYYCVANHGDPSVGHASAYGCFEADGDQLQVADGRADGKRVALQWRTDYGRFGLCVNKDGKDFVLRFPYGVPGGSRVCIPSGTLAEGRAVTIRVGTCDADVHDCSKAGNYGEWSDRKKLRT